VVRKTHHVVHNSSKGGWDIKRGGGEQSSVHTKTKAEAIKVARVISRRQSSELIIHGMDGKIQRSDSHGNDPNPPKDKK